MVNNFLGLPLADMQDGVFICVRNACFCVQRPKRVENAYSVVRIAPEKYYRKYVRDDEEEMDVDRLGLSSHS